MAVWLASQCTVYVGVGDAKVGLGGKGSFERVDGLLLFASPAPGRPLANEGMQRGSHVSEALDEATVEVEDAQQRPQLANVLGVGRGQNLLHLGQIR